MEQAYHSSMVGGSGATETAIRTCPAITARVSRHRQPAAGHRELTGRGHLQHCDLIGPRPFAASPATATNPGSSANSSNTA
jgi:hypothetical protein